MSSPGPFVSHLPLLVERVWDRMLVLREKMTCLGPRGEAPDLQAMAVIIDQGEKKDPVGGGEPSGSGGEGVMI